ncbi:peptidylprolyl isomerase [Hyphomonas sp.]|uniref:peptidylprolyl isomerase n=1 Tax=Hyphomonas sp. TaxID=87 RepID=UPI0025BF1330|nr:peptidylprolyl isomerase [Hyphomonas sp.]
MLLLKPFSRNILISMSVALALLATACGRPVEEEPVIQVEAATAVSVNGDPIHVSEVELEAVARGLISPGQEFGPGDENYDLVLDQLIDQKLMAQEALARGLDKGPTAERRLEVARERILGNLLVESLVASEVNEDSIEAMYKEQVALQQEDDEVSIAHILVETEAEARALYQQIEEGATFESLVVANSLDSTTRMENGDLGYVSPNNMADPFPVVIANTKVGEVSEPFLSADGWHILKVKDRRTSPPKTRDEMRPEIVTFLTLNQVSKILRRLRTEAKIEKGEKSTHIVPDSALSLESEGDLIKEQPASEPQGREL